MARLIEYKKKKKKKPRWSILNIFSMPKNKKGVARGPTLTWFMIGLVVFIGIVLLIYSPNFGVYNQFMLDNGGTIDPRYAAAYDNITSNAQSLTDWSQGFSAKSFASNLLQTASGMLNSFAIGFSAIRLFTQVPTFFFSIFSVISSVTGIPQPVFWMIMLIVTVYFASKFIKGMRGTIDDL